MNLREGCKSPSLIRKDKTMKALRFTIELKPEEIELLEKRQLDRMQWIMAGMDEKEPIDFVIQKICNAAKEAEEIEYN